MKIGLPIWNDGVPPASPRADGKSLVDSYGRVIRDLRVSLTDRCNYRCVYCMDPDVRFMRKVDMMTDTEIVRLVRVCAGLGVKRIRLTGGEPSLHPTLTELIADLSSIGLDDIAMTTNGSRSTRTDLERWRDAGLDRITVSLDSLDTDRFRAMTRSDDTPEIVLETARLAREVGLGPIKINVVIIRGYNDGEIADFAQLARETGFDVRLIEFMPLDSGRRWTMEHVVPGDEMIEKIEERFELVREGRERKESPASAYTFADGAPGKIGVIASVTRPFCGACSRLRVTADGKVMPCLFSTEEWDLRGLLRGGSDDDIARFLADATWAKQAGHRIRHPDYVQPDRPMSAIGG